VHYTLFRNMASLDLKILCLLLWSVIKVNSSGMLFVPHGQLYVTTGEWIVNMDLHIPQLETAVSVVSQQCVEFSEVNTRLM
jgi:hypothetical protein